MAEAQTDSLARVLCERYEELLKSSERGTLQGLWDELSRYVMPHEQSFSEINPHTGGILRHRDLLDSTAMRSLELFASSIHSLMNNPASQWFNLGLSGTPRRELPISVQQSLDLMGREMLRELTGRGVQLYSHLHSSYMSLGAFGTACIYVGDMGDGVHLREFPVADICIDQNAQGAIDTVFRREWMTIRQMRQRWPDLSMEDYGATASRPSISMMDDIEVTHGVFPSSDLALFIASQPGLQEDGWIRKAKQQAKATPWLSIWVNKTDAVTLGVGGFQEMPYMVPRWYVARGEIYGRSPGMTVLPDARMTNRMMDTIVRGAEKLVDPPLMLPHGSLLSPLRVWPGSITYTDGIVAPQPLLPPGASRVEYGQDILLTRQQAIREGFFTPLFATPESPVKTATQVLQEADERNRAISPMLIRMQEELFHPLLFRCFWILARQGKLSLPDGVNPQQLDIEYVSPLMAANRQSESLGAIRAMEGALPWAELDRTIADIWHPERVAKIIHDGSGMPAEALRTRSEMDALHRRREEEQKMRQANSIVDPMEAVAKLRTADASMIKAGSG